MTISSRLPSQSRRAIAAKLLQVRTIMYYHNNNISNKLNHHNRLQHSWLRRLNKNQLFSSQHHSNYPRLKHHRLNRRSLKSRFSSKLKRHNNLTSRPHSSKQSSRHKIFRSLKPNLCFPKPSRIKMYKKLWVSLPKILRIKIYSQIKHKQLSLQTHRKLI